MAGGLLPQPKQLVQDNAWNPGIAYQLYTYEPASLTPKGTYQDQALTIANTNPVLANARGEVVMYGSGSYRIILKDSLGSTIWDRDNIDALISGALLISANGASLVGYDDSTLDVSLKSRLKRIVNNFSEIRALNKTKYTRASAIGGSVSGDGGAGDYWLDTSDTSSADDGFSTLVAADNGRWKRLNKISQSTTTATDVAAQFIERTTSHTGGTAGYVNGALRVTHTVGAGVTNFEWGITSVMNNSAATGENVAIYGQGNKLSTGPTWGGVMEARDKTNLADPAAGLIGMEIDVFANGTDANQRRIGVDLVAGKGVAGGATAEIYAGVRIGPSNIDPTQAYFDSGVLLQGDQVAALNIATTGTKTTWGIKDTGNKPVGIDLTATYSIAALRMSAGSKLAFDSSGTVYMAEAGGILSLTGSYLNLNSSFGMPGAGNVTTTATAGAAVLPAAPQGFVSFKIDGTTFKFPYYQA